MVGTEATYCGKLRERDNLKNVRIDGKGILKWILKKRDGTAWLSIEANGGLLRTQGSEFLGYNLE